MKVKSLPSYPPGVNPFTIDMFQMGTYVCDNLYVMYGEFNSSQFDLVNPKTGERFRIIWEEQKHQDRVDIFADKQDDFISIPSFDSELS